MSETASKSQPAPRYELLGRLGIGGMAEVHLARMLGPSDFERIVVIKRMLIHLGENPSHVAMFHDEAKLLARIQHRNVVQVYGLHHVDGRYEIIMEYLDGETTASYFEKVKPVDPWLAAFIIAEAAQGLHAAHELTRPDGSSYNVVHRDVSPQNIFITYDGDVKVLDFGVARAEDRHTRTESGVIKGKLSYMAPEQIADHRAVDRRSDIFALGTLLYELSTGKPLFERGGVFEVVSAVCTEPVEPPSQRVSGYPPELEAICMRALQKAPKDRYQTAAEMARDLQLAASHYAHPAILKERLARLMSEVFFERRTHKRLMMERSALEVSIEAESEPPPFEGSATPVPLPATLSGAIARAREQDTAAGSHAAAFNDDDTIVVPEGESMMELRLAILAEQDAEAARSASQLPLDFSGGITGPLPRSRPDTSRRATIALMVVAGCAAIAVLAGAGVLWVSRPESGRASEAPIDTSIGAPDAFDRSPTDDVPTVEVSPATEVGTVEIDEPSDTELVHGISSVVSSPSDDAGASATALPVDAGADSALSEDAGETRSEVRLRISTQPRGATVRVEGGGRCVSPCVLSVPRSDAPIRLRARKRRRSGSVEIVPEHDQRVRILLRRRRRRRPAPPDDIPDVFTDFDAR